MFRLRIGSSIKIKGQELGRYSQGENRKELESTEHKGVLTRSGLQRCTCLWEHPACMPLEANPGLIYRSNFPSSLLIISTAFPNGDRGPVPSHERKMYICFIPKYNYNRVTEKVWETLLECNTSMYISLELRSAPRLYLMTLYKLFVDIA